MQATLLSALYTLLPGRWLGVWLGCMAGLSALAQQQPANKTLSPEEFLNIVRTYHPVAKQAGLMVDYARAELLASRGMFDPSLYFSQEKKVFDGKNYYDYSQTALKIPTWFGIEVQAGLDFAGGDNLNSESTAGKSSYAGLSMPLAKNLLMDQRRAALMQGKLFVEQSKAEQQLLINDLMFEAIGAYWEWTKQYNLYRVITEALEVNRQRFQLIKVTIEQGDRPGIDSVEAYTQLISFRAQQAEAYAAFLNSGYDLSNFLWVAGNQPYLLDSTVRPSINTDLIDPASMPVQPLTDLLSTAQLAHPKLQSFGFKLDALDIERRLKFQSLLPTVNLKYNALTKGYEFWNSITPPSSNDYKFGVQIGMPLFLREGRGNYEAAKIKIADTRLDQDMTSLAITNKVKEYYTTLANNLQQVRLNEQAVDAYRQIFDVESMRFEIGESTQFLMNARENKVLEARQKLTEVKAKYFKSLYGVQWAAGVLR